MIIDDEQLIQAVIKGDRESADFLVNKYYKIIYSFVYKLTQDYHISYDLTQEVFIKAIRSIKKYKHQDKLKAWLLAIASNSVKDYFRKESREKLQVYDINLDIEDQCSNNSLEKLEREENKEYLKRAIDALSLDMKEVIMLRYFYNMKISEISKITSTNESTVKTRLRRALKYLNNKLEGGADYEKKAY
ncbi:RNA polymerase sigma factor [Clostridium sp. YIM B02505]|uniref:RNA polymerase sigma factor n=1 Tax=Clostridium yunnanense TaxID=2800325 RepID=A0ABS1EJV9_9CLOT|nr:RNA polymerase sigma factor [Clostridium yunnanense]MBK1809623.1 RNA polymerase sigma factor [Clostridium yunnanense]